jgi:O-antigen ligase
VNLADDDGFQVLADGSLRSPHSAHFEILARSGVPGLVSWLFLQLAVLLLLVRSVRRAWQGRAGWWLAVGAWLGVLWLAQLVNMSFDVYLAGPMGGFWFWGVVGAIMALDRVLSDPVGKAGPIDTRHEGLGVRA